MNIKDTINYFFRFPLIDASVALYLIVDGREYEVEQFKTGFNQTTDHKGEPQAEVKGGQLVVSLSQTVPENIYSWILKPGERKDGQIVFRNQTSNAPLRIQFFNGVCISFNREVNSNGGLQTNLVISPERVKINDVEHDNFWVE